MTPFYHFSSCLRCEIKIVGVRDIDSELVAGGSLFVRYYVSAGDGRRIRVDTRQATGTSDGAVRCWDHELAALERRGAVSDPTRELLEPCGKGVAFELRWRPGTASASSSFLGSLIPRSKLLARSGVVAWEDVAAAPSGKLLEKWIPLVAAAPKRGVPPRGRKLLPSLLVEMSVEMAAKASPPEERRRASWWVRAMRKGSGCDCRDCEWAASEVDVFQAAVTCNAW